MTEETSKLFTFTEYELRSLQKDPLAYELLVNYHDYCIVCADASDMSECIPYHKNRIKELQAEAERLTDEYDYD